VEGVWQDPGMDAARVERLVLVSDASTEAERLITSLRVRRIKVRDVPLALLAGRVETQRPKLVICDGRSPDTADVLARVRRGEWGRNVELLLLGNDPGLIEALREDHPDIGSRAFARPIDVYSILQRIEEIVGEEEGEGVAAGRSLASLPKRSSAGSISSQSGIPAAPTPVPQHRRGHRSNGPQAGPSQPAPSSGAAPSSSGQRQPPSLLPNSNVDGAQASAGSIVPAKMSVELEKLLKDADRRLSDQTVAVQSEPSCQRLSPEQELDAVLPPDVLAALDDLIDIDGDDDTSNPGRESEQRHRTPNPRDLANPPALDSTSRAREVESHTGGTSPTDDRSDVDGPEGLRSPYGSGPYEATADAFSDASVPSSRPSTPHAEGSRTANSVPSSSHSERSLPQASVVEHTSDRRTGTDTAAGSENSSAGRRFSRTSTEGSSPGTNPESSDLDTPFNREESSTTPPRGGAKSRMGDEPPRSARARASTAPQSAPAQGAGHAGLQNPTTRPPLAGAKDHGLGRAASTESHPPSDRRFVDPQSALGSERAPTRGSSESSNRPPSIPVALGPGDVASALARCVRSRFSGALVVEDDNGTRRAVLRDGDFVTVVSGVEGESLVTFLIQRGDLKPDAARLGRKLPQFGRHAGAALIAHGYLRQDELWPVLRAHAEWLLGRMLSVERGSASLEIELPARLLSEPAVFGGSTGAEILIEALRRIVPPQAAITSLGGLRARLTRGTLRHLLSECALLPKEIQLVERTQAQPLEAILAETDEPDFAAVLYALVELGVLDTLGVPNNEPGPAPVPDILDDEAIRARVAVRRGLVEEGDYFSLLGIDRNATGYEIRHAYLALRREFDPARLLTAATADLREDVETILEVLDEAYDVLRDPERRARYCRALGASPL